MRAAPLRCEGEGALRHYRVPNCHRVQHGVALGHRSQYSAEGFRLYSANYGTGPIGTALQLGNAKKGDKETIGPHRIASNKTAQTAALEQPPRTDTEPQRPTRSSAASWGSREYALSR